MKIRTAVSGDDCLIKLPGVLARIPVSRATIYRLIKRREFPKPRKIGHGSFWSKNAITMWLDSLPDAD